MTFLLLSWIALFDMPAEPPCANVIVIVGAAGSEEFGRQFRQWSDRWSDAAKRGNAEITAIGLTDSENKISDHDQLQQLLAALNTTGSQPVWLIFIGHGTFDGKLARFNLRGPDLTLPELSDWVKPIQRPLTIVNCASCSGPFLNELSGPGRIIVTSTKSGHEYNFSRFGDFLSSAIGDPQADLDKDDQTSLLEAFLLASARTREFYENDGRLMTEHALLDDNHDRLGTPADWFQGVRAIKSAKNGASVDGLRANQLHLIHSPSEERLAGEVREKRDQLEQELAQLRTKKASLAEADYLQQIEPILVKLARLYETP